LVIEFLPLIILLWFFLPGHIETFAISTVFYIDLLTFMGSILGCFPVSKVYQTRVSCYLVDLAAQKPKPNAYDAEAWLRSQHHGLCLFDGATLEDSQQRFALAYEGKVVSQGNDQNVVTHEVNYHGFVLLTQRLDGAAKRLLNEVHAHHDNCKSDHLVHLAVHLLIRGKNGGSIITIKP
jgi:hypothetical protein